MRLYKEIYEVKIPGLSVILEFKVGGAIAHQYTSLQMSSEAY